MLRETKMVAIQGLPQSPSYAFKDLIDAMQRGDLPKRDSLFDDQYDLIKKLKPTEQLEVFKAALAGNHWIAAYEVLSCFNKKDYPIAIVEKALEEVFKYGEEWDPDKFHYWVCALLKRIAPHLWQTPPSQYVWKTPKPQLVTRELEKFLVNEIIIYQKLEKLFLYENLKKFGFFNGAFTEFFSDTFMQFFEEAFDPNLQKRTDAFLLHPEYMPNLAHEFSLTAFFHYLIGNLNRILLDLVPRLSDHDLWLNHYEEWNNILKKVENLVFQSQYFLDFNQTLIGYNGRITFLTFVINKACELLNYLYDNADFSSQTFMERRYETEKRLLAVVNQFAIKTSKESHDDINPLFYIGIESNSETPHIERPYQAKIVKLLAERGVALTTVFQERSALDLAVSCGNFLVAEVLLPRVTQNLSKKQKNDLLVQCITSMQSRIQQNQTFSGYAKIAILLLFQGANFFILSTYNEPIFSKVLGCLNFIINKPAEKKSFFELIEAFLRAHKGNRLCLENFLVRNILVEKKISYLKHAYLPLKEAGLLTPAFRKFFKKELNKQQAAIQCFWRNQKQKNSKKQQHETHPKEYKKMYGVRFHF